MTEDEELMEFRAVNERVREKLVPFLAGFYLCFPHNGGTQVITRGGASGCACSTPKGYFFVTCDHVLAGLQDHVARNPGHFIAATMCNWFYKLENVHILGHDSDVDVAAFTCDPRPIFVPPPGVERLCFKARFPSVVPKVGDTVYAFGYPGAGREPYRQDYIFMTLAVSSVSERGFVCAPTEGPRTLAVNRSTLVDEFCKLGGASGGPVYLSNAEGFQLIGVVRGGETAQDTLFVASLRFLNEDGSIDWAALPPK